MASSSGRSFALLFSTVTLLTITTFLTPACSSGLGEPNNNPKLEVNANDNGAPKKVPLALYYEALCPGCSDFIVNGLASMFKDGLIDIVDLELVPWGNARLTRDNKFECQHGPEECLLNTIEACAINVWPSLSKNFPFIYCVEALSEMGKEAKWENCFQKSGLDPKPVRNCYSSGYGKKLELKYANMTDRLRPPHEFVPWVVVDGQPLKEDFGNFTSYVCKAYKGPLPPACNNLSFDNNVPRQKTDRALPFCYNEETTTKM